MDILGTRILIFIIIYVDPYLLNCAKINK
jgi:hypothetical protein